MRYIGVYGASGCGRGVMPLVRQQFVGFANDCELIFIDDQISGSVINGHRVLNYSEWLSLTKNDTRQICIAVANSTVRERLVLRCKQDGVDFISVRASNVVEMDDVIIGEGAILCPFVTLTSNIRIGVQFHANIYSYVEHDCTIGNYVTFAPGVQCNGNVVIEDHVYIGAGAILRQGTPSVPMIVGRGAVVGMGAVVTKSVAAGTTVVGVPARSAVGRLSC